VIGDAGNLPGNLAGKEVAPTTVIAEPAVSAIPADPDPLVSRPSDNARADGINEADYLMPRNPRVLNPRKAPFLGKRVAVANSPCLYFNSHRTGTRLRNFAFNDFKIPFRVRDLHDTHLRHHYLLSYVFTGRCFAVKRLTLKNSLIGCILLT